MQTAIPRPNGRSLTAAQVMLMMQANREDQDSGYQVLVEDDLGKRSTYNALQSADGYFTLPVLGAGQDGWIYHFFNDSYYELTLKTAASVWNSGTGYGVTLITKGSMVSVQWSNSAGKFDVIAKVGTVHMEGTVLYEPMNKLTLRAPGDADYGRANDLTGRQLGETRGGMLVSTAEGPFGYSGCFQFDGTDDYLRYTDFSDWDIFGDQVGHKTVSLWVYNDAVGAAQDSYLCQWVDGSNYWYIGINSSGNFMLIKTGATIVDIQTGALSATTWTHVAVVIDGSNIGTYLDGVQVGWETGWTIANFTASLYIGQSGAGVNWFDGRMQDLLICYNNIFNAAPNSGLTDSFTVPAAPLQVVM